MSQMADMVRVCETQRLDVTKCLVNNPTADLLVALPLHTEVQYCWRMGPSRS